MANNTNEKTNTYVSNKVSFVKRYWKKAAVGVVAVAAIASVAYAGVKVFGSKDTDEAEF